MAYQFTQTGAEIQDILDLAQLQIAAPYDAGTSYTAGDYCTKDDGFYVCTASTSGTWDASKWSAVTVGDVLETANANISSLNSNLTQLFTATDVNINITIGGNGYASLASYAPTVPSGYSLFLVVCMGVSSITSKDAFTVEADGGYVYGTPNATINGLLLRYIYVRSAVM